MKVIQETRMLDYISTSSLLTLGRYLCWWTLSPGEYHPTSVSPLTWFIGYILIEIYSS